jgi:hypothetical protein
VTAPVYSGATIAPPRLNSQETLALLSGNTVAGVAGNGQPYHAFYRRDGVLVFREGDYRDRGGWHVAADGSVCSSLTKINVGVEQCYALYRNGTNVDFNRPDGTRVGTFTVEAGNPQNL